MKGKNDMGIFKIFGYGLGSMSNNFIMGVFQSFLLIFYTDVFGIPAMAVSVIFLISKIWDAVNDPMMGAIVDKSPVTRFGKYRPYILFASLPLAIVGFLCFCTPNFSVGGKIVYAAITYTLFGMIFTAYDVPYWAMVPSLSEKEHTRNKLISCARTLCILAMLIASACTEKVVTVLGGGSDAVNKKIGYPKYVAILGVIAVVCAIITFFSTKEVNAPKNEAQSANIFREFKKVCCKPLVMVLISMGCCAMGMAFPATTGAYYMIYYIGNPAMIGLCMIICMGMAMIGSAAAPVFVKKIPAKVMTIVGFLSDIIMGVIIMILGRGSLSVLFVCFGIVGFFIGVRLVTITVMLMQTAQYIAEKNGSRADGICFSLNSFANKIGQALAGAAVSMILAVTGYVANAQQTELAANGILITRSLLPAVIGIAGLVFTVLWKLDTAKKKQV